MQLYSTNIFSILNGNLTVNVIITLIGIGLLFETLIQSMIQVTMPFNAFKGMFWTLCIVLEQGYVKGIISV